jgi:enamine deaminase RidA (YjgF/YER057c/UK114 family)
MGVIDERLKGLGITLPSVPKPIANYVGSVRTGNLLFLAGRGPRRDGQFVHLGKLGKNISIEEGYEAARLTTLNLIATIKGDVEDLDRVTRIVKLLGMVNAAPDFTEHSSVINGASDLLVEVFGERGKHARSALGVSSLPMNVCVEIELVVEVDWPGPTAHPL